MHTYTSYHCDREACCTYIRSYTHTYMHILPLRQGSMLCIHTYTRTYISHHRGKHVAVHIYIHTHGQTYISQHGSKKACCTWIRTTHVHTCISPNILCHSGLCVLYTMQYLTLCHIYYVTSVRCHTNASCIAPSQHHIIRLPHNHVTQLQAWKTYRRTC